jgi:hypothetical protein
MREYPWNEKRMAVYDRFDHEKFLCSTEYCFTKRSRKDNKVGVLDNIRQSCISALWQRVETLILELQQLNSFHFCLWSPCVCAIALGLFTDGDSKSRKYELRTWRLLARPSQSIFIQTFRRHPLHFTLPPTLFPSRLPCTNCLSVRSFLSAVFQLFILCPAVVSVNNIMFYSHECKQISVARHSLWYVLMQNSVDESPVRRSYHLVQSFFSLLPSHQTNFCLKACCNSRIQIQPQESDSQSNPRCQYPESM